MLKITQTQMWFKVKR